MFTGIIQEVGKVVSSHSGSLIIGVNKVLKGVELGGSVSVNGACLTVTQFNDRSFSVDVTPETLRRTNLGLLSPGDPVNLERPMALGGELGGHLVQGHVDGTGKLTALTSDGAAFLVTIEAPQEITRYIVEKGFIAVDGISLTVTERNTGYFRVSVVDYTRKNTNLSTRKAGDLVNLEADIIAKYVEQFTRAGKGVTAEFLREHGF